MVSEADRSREESPLAQELREARLVPASRLETGEALPRAALGAALEIQAPRGGTLVLADLVGGKTALAAVVPTGAEAEAIAQALPRALSFSVGGPLLALVSPEPPDVVEKALERARRRIEASSAYGSRALDPRFGIARIEGDGAPADFLRRADQALHQARERPSGVAIWTPDSHQEARGDPLGDILSGESQDDYRRVALLAEALAAASRATGLEAFLGEFLDLVIRGLGANRGVVFVMERAREGRVLLARDDRGGDIAELSGHSRSIPLEVYESGRAVSLVREVDDQPVPASVARSELRSILCVPLRIGTERIGVLYLDSKAPRAVGAGHDLAFLQALADRIAPGIAALLERDQERRAEIQARQALSEENARLRSAVESDFVHQSPRMARVLDLARKVAPTEASVLVTGESGCGKERIARHVHANSRRSGQPLVVVNCAAIPRDLIESELFGHEKGAFTGATSGRLGKLEMANGGTVFLDEIGEIPLELQPKLLRFLQHGEIEKVGSRAAIRVDARILAATNRDLRQRVAEGRFREDLFFRLNVFPIEIPPLRERPEDVVPIFEASIARFAARLGRPAPDVSPAVRAALDAYSWPGNVRELENCAERSLILAEEGPLEPSDLGLPLGPLAPVPASHLERSPTGSPELPPRTQGPNLKEVERQTVLEALSQARGNKARAARLLGIPRTTLYHKLREHGIEGGP